MGTVTFLAPASPQWLLLQLKMMNVLRRSLGNESHLGSRKYASKVAFGGNGHDVLRRTRLLSFLKISCFNLPHRDSARSIEICPACPPTPWSQPGEPF